jgi:putative membrane protein
MTLTSDQSNAIRTHLANERTFLAWMRSSVSLLALGIGIAAFLDHQSDAARVLLAIASIAVGLAVIAFGYHRYRVMRTQIEHGDQYQPYTRVVALAAACIAVLACGSALVVALQS